MRTIEGFYARVWFKVHVKYNSIQYNIYFAIYITFTDGKKFKKIDERK